MRAVPQMWPSAGATRSALNRLSRVGPASPPISRNVPGSHSAVTRSRQVMRPAARARSTAGLSSCPIAVLTGVPWGPPV